MATMIVNVLSDPKDRGQNKACYAISEDFRILEVTIVNSEDSAPLAAKLTQGKFVVLQHYNINDAEGATYVRLINGKSKIFQTGKTFDVPKDILDNFYNPPQCTVPEALASPKKRKLSIDGSVTEIYALRTGNNWQRRDLILEDPATKKKICVKLWNEHANTVTEDTKGKVISLKNVEVDIFNSKHQLKTTDLTTITMTEETRPTTGQYEIVGVDKDGQNITVITACCKEFSVDTETLQAAGLTVEKLATATIQATLQISDNKITKIQPTENKPN